jgi:hypothetical protein
LGWVGLGWVGLGWVGLGSRTSDIDEGSPSSAIESLFEREREGGREREGKREREKEKREGERKEEKRGIERNRERETGHHRSRRDTHPVLRSASSGLAEEESASSSATVWKEPVIGDATVNGKEIKCCFISAQTAMRKGGSPRPIKNLRV